VRDDFFTAPASTKKNPRTGEPYPCHFYHNKSGGADNKFGLTWFKFLMDGLAKPQSLRLNP
jgi:hypothetical protein